MQFYPSKRPLSNVSNYKNILWNHFDEKFREIIFTKKRYYIGIGINHEPTVFCSFAHLRDLWWHYCSGWWCSPVYVRCRWWKKELDYLLSWLVGNIIIIIIHHFHWNWAALILSDQLDYLASSKSGFTFSAGARILVLLVYVLLQKRTFEIKSTSWTDTKKN